MDDDRYDRPLDRSMVAELQRNAQFNADNPETRLWVLAWRAIEALGDQGLIDDFGRRFMADLERRYPRAERRAREAKIWPR
jgi:hypothetical protein